MSQDFLGEDFKSQGSHVAYNVAEYSTQALQTGYGVEYVTQGTQGAFPGDFLNHTSQSGYSVSNSGNDLISQDYIPHGSQGLFTQVGFNDRTQDEPTHFGLGGPLQSQGPMNPMYAQPFTQYTHTLNQQAQQQQEVQQQVQQQGLHNQRPHYNG